MAELESPADTRTEHGIDVDASFRAILEGLRTSLPGVHVLFAFLLILPFQAGFSQLRGIESVAYYVAFLASAASSILLIAPGAHQRLRAPWTGVARHSQAHLEATVRLTIVGTVTSAIALIFAVFLVSILVFDDVTGYIAAGVATVLAGWAWFYIPLVTFRRRP